MSGRICRGWSGWSKEVVVAQIAAIEADTPAKIEQVKMEHRVR